MLKINEYILNKVTEDFARVAAQLQSPAIEAARSIAKMTEPIRIFEEQMRKNHEAVAQMSKLLGSVDLPRIISNDVIAIWKDQEVDIEESIDNPTELAEDISYTIVESAERLIDDIADDSQAVQFRLTSNGKFFLVEGLDKPKELTLQMELLIRTLKKDFIKTSRLVVKDGYTTERSVREAIGKLNGWSRSIFGLKVPIVIGRQGKGYKLSKHVQIHKIPRRIR